MLQAESITLEYKMTPGEVLSYKSWVESAQKVFQEGSEPESHSSKLALEMEQRVKSADPKGLIDLDVIITQGEVFRDGEPLELPSVGQTIGMSMKRNGDIVKTSVNFSFSQPAFPEKALKIGDKWTAANKMEIPLGDDGKKKSVDLVYQYTLDSFERQKGYEVAVIKVVCPSTTVEIVENVIQIVSATGTTYFAHREGRLIGSDVHTHTELTAPDAKIETDVKVGVSLENATGTTTSGLGFAQADEQFMIGM